MTETERYDAPAAGSRPALVVFDVNETLSDLSPLRQAFEEAGLGAEQVGAWFAGVLRDGFALTCVGANPAFADLAAEGVRGRVRTTRGPEEDPEPHVERVMGTFQALDVHADVVDGVRALRAAGIRLVTMSNGSASVAEALLERSGLSGDFERLMSVEDAGAWKPHPAAYRHALEACGVEAGEAMLVAVHPWDIDGAARAGLRTGWLNRDAARYPAYFRTPDLEVTDLPELARLVG